MQDAGDEIDEKIYSWLMRHAADWGLKKLKNIFSKALTKSSSSLNRIDYQQHKDEDNFTKISLAEYQTLPDYENGPREFIHLRLTKDGVSHKFYKNRLGTEYLTFSTKDLSSVANSFDVLNKQLEKAAERAEEYLNRQREKEEPAKSEEKEIEQPEPIEQNIDQVNIDQINLDATNYTITDENQLKSKHLIDDKEPVARQGKQQKDIQQGTKKQSLKQKGEHAKKTSEKVNNRQPVVRDLTKNKGTSR